MPKTLINKKRWRTPSSGVFETVPITVLSENPCEAFSIFVTNGISYSTAQEYFTFQVALTGEPTDDVTVTLESECFYFSTCALLFTPQTWNQVVEVKAFPKEDASPNCPIFLSSNSTDPNFQNKTTQTVPTQTSTPNARALSWGDPHINTFDGNYHDFYDIGDYYLVRQTNGEFVIQVRQNVCSTASCNYATAIKFRSTIFYTYLTPAGIPSTSLVGDPSSDGVSISYSAGSFEFKTLTGIRVHVFADYWPEEDIFFLGIDVYVKPSYLGKLYGLAGFYDGNPNNDFTTPSGLFSDVTTFQYSWAVPDAENLFRDSQATIPAILGGTSEEYIPRYDCSNSEDPSDITSSLTSNSTDSPFANETNPFDPEFTPDPNVANTTEAEQICNKYFNTTEVHYCETEIGLDPSPYYQNCIVDVGLTGSESFAQESVVNYYAECESEAEEQGKTFDPCPNLCSGRGNCTDGVCSCEGIYEGEDCSRDPSQKPEIKDAPRNWAGIGCDLTVNLFGFYFYGPTLYCRFGNLQTLATRISDFQVYCQVPYPENGEAVVSVQVTNELGESQGPGLNFTYYLSCCEDPCPPNHICNGSPNTIPFTCTCPTGLTGENCTEG